MDRGELVPDDVIIAMMLERLARGRRARRLPARRLPAHDRAGRRARRAARRARPAADRGAADRRSRRRRRAAHLGRRISADQRPRLPRRLRPAEGRGPLRRRRLRARPARGRSRRDRPAPARGLPRPDRAADRLLRASAACCAASTARCRPTRSTTTSARRCDPSRSRSRCDHPQDARGDRQDRGRGRRRRAHAAAARAARRARASRPPTRRCRREVHPLPGRRADVQGLPRLSRLDLRLAELDDRARHPRPVRARARGPDLARRRRHARRLGRRRRADALGRAPSALAQTLLEGTEQSLHAGIEQCPVGNRLGDVSHAIQAAAESRGLAIVRTLVGHGVGRKMHEDPQIPNYGEPGTGPKLLEGWCSRSSR